MARRSNQSGVCFSSGVLSQLITPGMSGFLALEEFFQGTFHQFLGRDADREVDRQATQVGRQAKQADIYGSGGHDGNIDALGIEFVPQRLGEIVDKGLGGIIGLDTRHSHPCGHRRHIEYIAPLARMSIDALSGLLGGQLALQHIFAKEAAEP